MKIRKWQLAFLAVCALLFLGAPTASVMAADGVNGSIDLDITSVNEGTLLYVDFINLDASSDYLVNTTNDATGYSFTTGSGQTSVTVPIQIEKPATTNAFSIYLNAGSGATEIDQVTMYVTESTDILNTAAFLGIVIPLIVFAIVVLIYRNISAGRKT